VISRTCHAGHSNVASLSTGNCSDVNIRKVEGSIASSIQPLSRSRARKVPPSPPSPVQLRVPNALSARSLIPTSSAACNPSSNLGFQTTCEIHLIFRPAQPCPLRLRWRMLAVPVNKWRENHPQQPRPARRPQNHDRIRVRRARRARSNATRLGRLVIAARGENTG
jgi:hypothetical protein